jgi:hypothetical protein
MDWMGCDRMDGMGWDGMVEHAVCVCVAINASHHTISINAEKTV